MPDTIQFKAGHQNYYTYDASGNKLEVQNITSRNILNLPQDTITRLVSSTKLTTDYCGDAIYQNDTLKEILTPEGYYNYKTGVYYYYLKDHQGNNRVVINSSGVVQEYSDYYPDGMRFWTSTSNSAALPYRYNGKELEAMNGLNEYDYGARRRETGIPVWTTMDPLAEKYYGVSPYAFCAGNPIYYVDPDGMKVIYNQNENGYDISGDDVYAYLGYLQDIQNGTGSMDNMLAACAAAAKGKGNGNAGTNLPTTEPEVTAIGFGPRPKETLSQSPMATRFEFWLNAKSNNFMEGALKMVASMAYAALNSPAITFTGMTWGGAYVDSPNGRILPLVDVATFGIGASIDKILPLAKATDGIQGFNAFMKANKSNFTGKEWQTEASKAFKMSRIQVQSIKDYDKSKSVLDIVSSMQTQYSK